jgi:predicted TIM-barrel fold metal-dependent hydrolase
VIGLGPEETAEYLAVVQSLRPYYKFYDTHVHPYEVLFDRFSYEDHYSRPGVLSLTGTSYQEPALKRFRFPEMGDFNDDPKSQRLQDISVMLLKKVYGNVGEQVFRDQMTLSGIDRSLLLPVASESCSPEQFMGRMRWVKKFYQDDERFWIAGSVPGSVEAISLIPYVRALKQDFGIKAVKCHPVVTGIDFGLEARQEWLEELLRACRESQLPLIIHSGRNNPYWGGKRGNFGALENLRNIDLSLSGEPVVLAHAGFHRCRIADIEPEGLRMLQSMLSAHPNLLVDISGLTFEPLKLVLRSLPAERILFGSDALYASQWEAVTMTMHALKEQGMPLEHNLIQFASINPRRTLFKDTGHVKYIQDQVESISGRSQGEIVP